MPVTLTPLATVTVKLGAPVFIPNTPRGTRAIVNLEAATWEGERLNATLKQVAAADWAQFTADGTIHVDVRCAIETHDGAVIFVAYQGRATASPTGADPIMIAPTFETGDERYAWLNKVQAIGRGSRDAGGALVYDLYEAS